MAASCRCGVMMVANGKGSGNNRMVVEVVLAT